MRPTSVRPLGLLALALAAGTASAQTHPAWRFKKGDVLKYDFVQKNDIKVVVNGEPRSTVSTLDLGLSWTVEDVKEGVASIAMTIDKARIRVRAPNTTVDYVSGSKEVAEPAREIARIYEAVVGKRYGLAINARGEVLDVQVPASITDVVKDSPFAAFADSGSVFSSKGLKLMLNQVIPRLPENPVKPGEKWKTSLDLPGGQIQLKLDTEYKLGGKPEGPASVEGTIVTTVTPTPPLTVVLKKHQGSIQAEFDVAEGSHASSTVKHSIDMDLAVNEQKLSQTLGVEASMKRSK